MRRRRSRPRPDGLVDEANRRQILATVSLLVGYPDHELLGQIPILTRVAAGLPEPSRRPLERFLT